MTAIRALAAAAALVATGCGSALAPAATSAPVAASAPSAAPPASAPGPPAAAPGPPAAAPHVMVIVMENREESEVIGRPDAPTITSLAARYGVATNWYGVSHPSLPNYLAMVSGSDQGVHDDGTQYSFAGPTFVDQLSAAGIGWRAYMEGMPSACYAGPSAGRYAKKHDPFVYFRSITGDPARCNRVVPHTELATDLRSGAAPPFLWVSPDLCDDGHDCPDRTADTWLSSEMQLVTGSDWYRRGGSVIVTWDEGSTGLGCCGGVGGGHIATIVVNAAGRRRHDPAGDHIGTLRALEETYGVGLLGGAASTAHGDLRPLLAT